MTPRTTLADVARETGFSKTTVSLALRMNPKIREATRKRVHEAAAKLGYVPDPALARIAAHRWRTRTSGSGAALAFVTTDHPLGEYVEHAAIEGARQRAEQLGYRLDHHRVETFASVEHLARTLYHRGIQGVIVGQLFAPALVTEFPWGQFACVNCNVGYYRTPVHTIAPDHSEAVSMGWRTAWERGYRRIGLVLFAENALDEREKTGAFLYAQSQSGAEYRVPPLRMHPRDHGALVAWLEEHQPDMVFGLNNMVRFWLEHRGWLVPKRVGFIDLYVEHDRADSSGMFLNNRELGASAVELVDLHIQHNNFGIPVNPYNHLLVPAWHEGNSAPVRKTTSAVKSRRRVS